MAGYPGLLLLLLILVNSKEAVYCREAEACYMNAVARTDTLDCPSGTFISLDQVHVGFSHNLGCNDESKYCVYHSLTADNRYFYYLLLLCQGQTSCELSSVELRNMSDKNPPTFHKCGDESTQKLRNKVKVGYSCVDYVPDVPIETTKVQPTLENDITTSPATEDTSSISDMTRSTSLSTSRPHIEITTSTDTRTDTQINGAGGDGGSISVKDIIIFIWLGLITVLIVVLILWEKCTRNNTWRRFDRIYKDVQSNRSDLSTLNSQLSDYSNVSQCGTNLPQYLNPLPQCRHTIFRRVSEGSYEDIDAAAADSISVHHQNSGAADNPAYINRARECPTISYNCRNEQTRLSIASTSPAAGVYVRDAQLVTSCTN